MGSATQTPTVTNNPNSRVSCSHNLPSSKLYEHEIPRYHDRIHLDAFRSPFNPLYYQRKQQPDRPPSPKTLSESSESRNPSDVDVTAPPRTIPLSFWPQHAARDRRKHSNDIPSPFSTSPGHLREFDCPVLNIRRTSSKSSNLIPTDASEYQLNKSPDEYEQKKHRSCRSAPNLLPHEMLPVDENGTETRAPSCDESHCTHHHHRQRSSSIISIKCNRSDDSDDNDVGDRDNNFFKGDIEASIQLEPMAPSMLVPLIDREGEMFDLLAHPSNQRWVGLVQHAVGKDIYKTKCLPLWCETARVDLSDVEWLRQSKKLLTKSHDNRLWRDFCGMVGWDEEAIPLEVQHSQYGKRASHDSLWSDSSGNMNSIKEESEPAEEDERTA